MLVNLISKGVTGKEVEKLLDAANITCNKNTIPNDPASPFVTSGIRLGTAAVTTGCQFSFFPVRGFRFTFGKCILYPQCNVFHFFFISGYGRRHEHLYGCGYTGTGKSDTDTADFKYTDD